MTENYQDSIDEILSDCLQQQFPGFEIIAGQLPDTPSGLVGQIGFLTKEGRGSLGVVAEQQALLLLDPDIGGRILDVTDWIGELANLTLGRIKINLRGPLDGIVSTTPVVLRDASVHMRGSDAVRTFRLESGDARVGVWIDLTSIDLTAKPQESSGETVGEGQGILFF